RNGVDERLVIAGDGVIRHVRNGPFLAGRQVADEQVAPGTRRGRAATDLCRPAAFTPLEPALAAASTFAAALPPAADTTLLGLGSRLAAGGLLVDQQPG